jgi:cell division protein FtsZ
MLQFDLPKEQSSIIKVIGVGGGGSNAVNYMHSLGIDGVDFVVCNTDAQALANSHVPNKVQLGPSLTQGLGAGANPEIGRQATEESLDEIRRILEVNTKMAFVTAGMGGGTGTGGAPIISKICKDMGILTVGIVTTPFSYEGKKRALHAQNGINQLKENVDTLLVISNDKLRHQFGNLTMSAALSTADNVLATAAKCITDVINSTGQINVDFADVCTVMRNGGVAILGSARAKGENRAQVAIEQALNSPLLNDNDIKGAKWILININSRTGDGEFTMDEVETIQEFLLTQAGPDADVILGLGYDESLGDEISITIIATGFEQKSPFGDQPKAEVKQEVKEEKIMFTLDVAAKQQPEPVNLIPVEPVAEITETPKQEVVLQQNEETVLLDLTPIEKVEPPVFHELTAESKIEEPVLVEPVAEINEDTIEAPIAETITEDAPLVFELDVETFTAPLQFDLTEKASHIIDEQELAAPLKMEEVNQQPSVASSGFLVKPAQIYVNEPAPLQQVQEQKVEVRKEEPIQVSQPAVQPLMELPKAEQDTDELIELVIHDEAAAELPVQEELVAFEPSVEEPAPIDEVEAQRARAAERLYKLRNLSFNFNAQDPNNEYESIPAYVRHNLQVHNTTLASVEKFYSSYSVGKDENNVTQISTINTFLEGKKPD